MHQAYANDMSAAGRGNDYNIELKSRLVPTIEGLIASSEIVLVGNRYDETLAPLTAAMGDTAMVDLARISPLARSNGLYQGICW